ncbi:MAG TPA: type II secretion system minor pseudopilin GspK, partial [Steroidobacteraceae bacterium]
LITSMTRSRALRSGRLPPARQRGIALLVAILLVALGTMIAAAIAYENAMTARRGAATLALDESVLIGEAAETLAAYGLREVWKSDKQNTYIGQGWDKPVGPVEVVPDVMLTASLEDLSGRFNLNSLVNSADGSVNQTAFAAFQQLLASLQIEPKWAGYIVDWIDHDIVPQNPDGAEDSVYMGQAPPYRTPNMYITSASELLALPGFGHERYAKLAPYVVALPIDAKLNICTAPGVVLDAFTPNRQEYGVDAAGLQKNRESAGACFPTLQQFQQAIAISAPAKPQAPTTSPKTGGTSVGPNGSGGSGGSGGEVQFATNSSYFRLTSFVTIGTTEFNLYSLMYQDATGSVRPLLRSYTPD